MKLLLVGCGNHPQTVYAPALRRLAEEDFSIVLSGCCDLNLSMAKAMGERAGFAEYGTDLLAMAQNIMPDAILVATAVEATAHVAALAASTGCPLLIEKPPGNTLAQVTALSNAVKTYGNLHQIAFNRHHMPLVRKLKSELADDDEPRHLQISMYRVNRTEPTFYTTAIHDIDLARFLAGAPYEAVEYRYQRLPRLGESVCNIYMDCLFQNGTTAQLAFLVNSGMVGERIVVSGQGRAWQVDLPIWDGADSPGSYRYYENNQLVRNLSGDDISDGRHLFETNGFYAQFSQFIKAVRTGRPPLESLDYAKESVAVAEEIARMSPRYTAP